MLSKNHQAFLKKTFSIFAVVRGYNVAVVALAQYLSAIFIFGSQKRALDVLLDSSLFLIMLSSTLAIAGGYIINSFYDIKKDLINRPLKTSIEAKVSRETQLRFYFTLNILSVGFASFISFRAVVFYVVYIFLLWFYSHKLKKYPIIGNLTAAFLAIFPFWGILFHFMNFEIQIFWFGFFLYTLLVMKELAKDMENLAGDFANNYQTIPVVYGIRKSKILLRMLLIFAVIFAFFLVWRFDVGYMQYYFYCTAITSLGLFIYVSSSTKKIHFQWTHLMLKIILFFGVLSIVLLNPEVVVHGTIVIDQIL